MLIRGPSCNATRAGQLMSLLLIPLIYGCAANTSTESLTIAERAEPDCSFRSPTTCWTVSGRYPPPRPRPAERPAPQAPKADSIKLASPTPDLITERAGTHQVTSLRTSMHGNTAKRVSDWLTRSISDVWDCLRVRRVGIEPTT